jgi:dihydrofolate reductase
MTQKISVFVATSIDGFIARKNGSIDWLDQANASVPSGEDGGFKNFMNSVDALVMGRNTFEQVLSFNNWPYGDKPMVVLSSKPLNIPSSLQDNVSSSSESPTELLTRLESKCLKHIYIDGGLTIQSFIKAGLVDEFTITLVPVVLGKGKPLFGPLEKDLLLEHIDTKTFDFGFVQLKYRVRK